MLQQLRSLLKAVVVLITLFFFLILICWVVPQPASAYSLKDLKKQTVEVGSALTQTASDVSKATIQTATSTSADIGSKVLSVSKATLNESIQVGTKVSSTALEVGKNATYKALETNAAIAFNAVQAGKTVTQVAINVSEEIGNKALEFEKNTVETAENLGDAATRKTVFLAEQTVTGVKSASFTIAHQITEVFKQYAQPLLEAAINQVDVNQLESVIRQVQQEVSEHTPEALAKQFIARKMTESLEIESWIETARLQAEMIYQIAAAYGFELRAPARRQEILDIAAANLGSGQLLKTSIPLIRYAVGQVPVAGDVLGVAVDWGSDRLIRSLMFPLLGQAACNYYTNLSLSLAPPALVLQSTSDAS